MIKALSKLLKIGALIDDIAEVRVGIRDIERELVNLKIELARQGEELDAIYEQHTAIVSLSHKPA